MLKPFQVDFVKEDSRTVMKLRNLSEESLKSVEILTVFLKDETSSGSPSRAHIRFESVNAISPKSIVALSHKTWANGRPVESADDQMERLQTVNGSSWPYVLDISWDNAEGRRCYQSIPVGH